ncbi:unnamed protein product [Closterium sp. NIES-53]
MALLIVLAFDHEGRPVAFDTWHDNLQLYLLSDIKDSVSLFDHVSGVAPALLATADGATRSQWLTHDATVRMLYFSSLQTAQDLYDAVVAHYSSPATAALGRLLLPYLFPELSAFATVADLITHLRTSDARYRATVPAEFLATNQPPMFIILYFIVSRLPDSLCSVKGHFLSLDPTSLTVNLIEQHLLAAETSAVGVGAARGTPRPPFFEGCSPSPISPSFASAAAANVSDTQDVGATSASAKRRNSKSKGGRGGGGGSAGGGGGSGSGGGGSGGGGGDSGGGGGGGSGGGSRGSGGSGGGSGGSGGSRGGGTGSGRSGPWRGGPTGGQRHETCPYVIRTGVRAGQTCGKFHTKHRCFSCLEDAWRAEFGDDVERPRWTNSLRLGVAIFDLDYDAIISVMYALSFSAEGDCYRCVPPDPGIAAAALGASASGTPPGTAPAEALDTFTLDSSASRCFFRDSTTLTPLPAPVPVRLADPSRGPVVAPLRMIVTVSGQGRERYFLLVVDDYTWYTTVFPLRSKGEVPDVLIPWIRTVRLQLRERFGTDLPVLRLHSDKCGDFSSDLLRDFCRGEGILQSFKLPDSPQQNGIAERRIGLVMEVARTSMIHAAAPHFLWPFAVQYAAHQLNLWPRVSLPETSPTVCWTGKVGDASVFRVWGSRAFVRDMSADMLSARAIPCVFLGFVLDAPGWQFYHPTSRRVLPSQDVTFNESVAFYRLFPYHSAPPPPPPLFLAPGPPPVDPLPPQGPAPSSVSHVDPLPGIVPVQVADGSGAARGAASGGAASGGAEPGGAGSEGTGSGGAESGGGEPGGAESEGAESRGAAPRGACSSGGPDGASPRLSLQKLREWLVRRAHRRSGAPGAGGAGDTGAGGAAVTTGAGGPECAAATSPGGARTSGAGAAGTGGVGCARAGDPSEPGAAGAGGAGAGGAGVGGPGVGGAGAAGAGVGGIGQVLGVPSSSGLPPPFLCPPPDHSQPPLQPASPLPAPSSYIEQSGSLTKRSEPASRPVLPVRTASRAPRLRPPLFPGTQAMALRPSSVPLRVPLPAPHESSLPEVPDPVSDRAPAASPTVSRLLASAVTDPSFESAAACALVAELLDYPVACSLDYATALVAESEYASPSSVRGECALGTDVLEDKEEDFEYLAAAVPRFASMLLALEGDPDAPDISTPRSYAEAITGPYSSQWQAALDAEMASWKSTGTYVDEVPPPWANIVDGMWILRVKQLTGSPPVFKVRYVAPGFSQRQGVDYFQTFSPTPKMTTLRVLLHVTAQRDYELHSLEFSTAFLQGSLHEEIWLRRPTGFTGTFPAVARHTEDCICGSWVCSYRGPFFYFSFYTSLPPFYVLVYVDDLVFSTADTKALNLVKFELQKRHICTDLGELRNYLGLQITRDRARRTITLTLSHMVHQVLQRFGFQFSLPEPTPLSTGHSLLASLSDESVEPSGLYPELVGCLMYLMTCTRPDLTYPLSLLARYVAPGRHRKGPVVLTGREDVFWVDDLAIQRSCEAEIYAGAMAAQELRWLTYLLTDLGEQPCSLPVLYQRGQVRLAYVATRANTADVFTKALLPGDHQRFATVLGLVPTLPHLFTA